MSIVNSDDGAGAVKVQVQSAIARILHRHSMQYSACDHVSCYEN